MPPTELYKRYRPKSLSRMLGNGPTIAVLKNMLETKRLPHTILFWGSSGTGKTTLGRILRKELECSDLDFKEMNCSDVRGIDSIRAISRTTKLAPAGGPCRVYLLDEVHQWSKDAQHAALKMLEDTPEHVYFFLCTTNPEKLLKTIRTRCCEMALELLSDVDLSRLIKRTCKKEKKEIPSSHLEDLVDHSDGSARRCMVLLDKLLNLPEDQWTEALKRAKEERSESIELCRALMKGATWNKISEMLRGLTSEPESARYAVLGYARSALIGKWFKDKQKAYDVICAFSDNFYDSKAAGLAAACYEVIHG